MISQGTTAFAPEDGAAVQVVSSDLFNEIDRTAAAVGGHSASAAPMTHQDARLLFAQAFDDVDRLSADVAARVETQSPSPEHRALSLMQEMWSALKGMLVSTTSAAR